LEVSENGYNNWRKRGKSRRKQDDEMLAERIEGAYHHHRGHYGSPRIHAELKGQEIHCRRKRVARLMREQQLSARKKRGKIRTTDSNHSFPVAPNLLKQDFTADAPNKKWVTDFPFIPTKEGWLFVAGVLDAYSRKIVGWSMSDCHDAEFVKSALSMALRTRQPGAGLVHHSDRGSEYASISYQMMLQEQNIQGSMSKKGDCYDNAMIESFWATLKEECIEETIFSTRKEAKIAIFEYIEAYYNRKRRHSSLEYMSPVEYETQGEKRERILLDK
jgi:transposase InsO family protein